MTSAHLFYIPAMLLVGMVAGFITGRRMLQAELDDQRRRAERQAARHQPPANP